MSNNNSRKPNEVILNQTSITSEDESPILSKLKELLEAAGGTDNCFPGLVLSIIGDSESYVPKPWNTVAFTSGLLQSIQGVKKSWVIYRGKTGGISRLIYDAFRETSNTKSPTEPKNKNKETFNNNTLIAIRPAKKIEKKGKDKVTEPNWCISLKSDFEDDQKPHPRRYKWFNRYVCHFLEKLSAEYTPLLSKENEKVLIKMRVPVLVIAVEGDQYTIHQIKEAVQRNIPVLLMKGSGKAVDFIIEYLHESSQVERENILKVNAPLLLGIYIRSEEVYVKLQKRMAKIQELSHLITIFDLNNTKNYQMEEYVVKAIIRVWSLKEIQNTTQNLKGKKNKRTVTMNIVEGGNPKFMETVHVTPGSLSLYFYIAYQYILESGEIKDKKKELELFLLEAIIANRVDYVSTLVQRGVIFDWKCINRLFAETLQCKQCNTKDCKRIHAIHLRVSTKCCDGIWCTCNMEKCPCMNRKVNDMLQNVCNICQKLLHYPKGTLDTKFTECSVEPICSGSNEQTTNAYGTYHDLLAWAIFAQREDLALIFWSKCENPLLTAIMTSSILNTMAEMVNSAKDLNLNNDLLKHSRRFEQRALFLMNSLYEENDEGCMSLMNTEDKVWGIRVAPVECAFDNGMIDVVGHPCVQRLLNRVWYQDTASMWRDWIKSLVGFHGGAAYRAAWTSPSMMFLIHYLLMLGILIAYSAFLLSNVKGITTFGDIGVYELQLYVWITADAIEEIVRNIVITVHRQTNNKQSRKMFRLYCYLTNFWNILALLLYTILISAVLVRIFNVGQRIEIRLYSLGLFIIYMRFFHSLMVLKYFGLKLIMIGKMLKELLQFSWILIVFIVCAGVMYHSNMYPNHHDMWPNNGAEIEHWRIWKILALPYWQLYGELSLDMLKGETNSNGTCTFVKSEWESNTNMERCVEYDWAIMVIAAIYMVISNLLLFNLIIALFSYRFEEVQNNSDRLWKYWRFAIIRDYSTRFPVPLNLMLHVINWVIICYKGDCKNQEEQNRKCIGACSLVPETLEKLQSKYATSRLYSEMTMTSIHSH